MSANYDRPAARASVDHIRRVSTENGGGAPVWAVQAAAQKLDVTERTVWNWLKCGVPELACGALDKDLETQVLQALATAHGNRKAAWATMTASGLYSKGYVQFTRDLAKLTPIQLAGVTEGVKAALAKGLYLKGTSTGRLDRVLFDHTEADIRLQRVYAGKLEMFRPWVTFLLDSHTRFILACIVTEGDGVRGDPGTESLVALLAAAIRGTDAADGTFVGGVPAVVQFDNAKAHLAKAMVNGYLELGVATHAIKPGSPWEDGRVERLMLTFSKELLVTLPGYTKALPDRYEHEPWIPEGCLTVEEFTAHLQEWIDIYNYERHHDALGMTPFEAWKEDSTPIRRVSNDLIRHGFLAETTGRKISKNGIRFNNVDFVHAALGKLVGKKVTIRHLPNDRSFIDVHLNGQFLCTAIPYARLSQDDRKQIVRDRNSQIRQTDRIIKRSGTRARQRELEGNPLLSPERNPSVPQRKVDDMSEEEFLVFVEETAGIGKEDDHDHNA